MEDNNKLPYFFLGLGIGVAVGILFAPQSGEETRDLIRSKADEGKDLIKRRAREARESAADALARGKDSIVRQRENLAAAVDAGKQAYRDSVAAAAAGSTSGGEGV